MVGAGGRPQLLHCYFPAERAFCNTYSAQLGMEGLKLKARSALSALLAGGARSASASPAPPPPQTLATPLRPVDVSLDAGTRILLLLLGGVDAVVPALPLSLVRGLADADGMRAGFEESLERRARKLLTPEVPAAASADLGISVRISTVRLPRTQAEGGGTLQVLLYEPQAAAAPQAAAQAAAKAAAQAAGTGPAILLLHGGGFVMNSVKTHDLMCRRLARGTRLRVVSVEYRMPPEHQPPALFIDALIAYRWAVRELDPRVALAGDSAGGQMCVSLALQLICAREQHARNVAAGGAGAASAGAGAVSAASTTDGAAAVDGRLPDVSLVLPCASAAELAQLPLPPLLVPLYGVFDLTRRPTASRQRYASGWMLSERLVSAFASHFGSEAFVNMASVRPRTYSPTATPLRPAPSPNAPLRSSPHNSLCTHRSSRTRRCCSAYRTCSSLRPSTTSCTTTRWTSRPRSRAPAAASARICSLRAARSTASRSLRGSLSWASAFWTTASTRGSARCSASPRSSLIAFLLRIMKTHSSVFLLTSPRPSPSRPWRRRRGRRAAAGRRAGP